LIEGGSAIMRFSNQSAGVTNNQMELWFDCDT
jgi:hypothetical protein